MDIKITHPTFAKAPSVEITGATADQVAKVLPLVQAFLSALVTPEVKADVAFVGQVIPADTQWASYPQGIRLAKDEGGFMPYMHVSQDGRKYNWTARRLDDPHLAQSEDVEADRLPVVNGSLTVLEVW